MNKARRYTAVNALSALLLSLLVLTDWMPILRGPQPDSEIWHWVYQLRPFSRWWWVLLAGGVMGGLVTWWLVAQHKITRLRTAVFLTLLAGAALFLQLSLVYADRGAAYTELIDRALAVQTNGYFWHAAQITDMSSTLQTYPEQMTTFESDHMRTHPPGLLLANWLTLRLADGLPMLDPVGYGVQHNRCTDLWLLDNPLHVSVALGVWAILPALVAVTAVFPAYLIGSLLTHNPRHAAVGAIWVALVPSLLIFAPTPDQLSGVLALWLIWLGLIAIRKKRYDYFITAGLLFSIMSFISIGNFALAIILIALPFLHQPKQNWLSYGLVFGLGTFSCWLILWLGWGVPPWDIVLTGLAEHEQLVLTNRAYTTWVGFNLVDLLTFLGLPILVGFVHLLMTKTVFATQSLKQLGWATAVLLLILNFSGSARGEVGRIWLLIFPIVAVSAGLFYARKLSIRQIVWVMWGQMFILMAVGLAWQPIEATIVVAERPLMAQQSPETIMNVSFENGISLTGTTISQQNDALDVTLFWHSEGGIQRPYTVFNHLLDAENNIVAQSDGWSVQGQWPTSCWEQNEMVIDPFTISLPDSLAAGEYRLFTGFYDAKDLSRLRHERGETAVFLTAIQVEEK
ncbi:MAG: hypothetical protein AAF490_24665 [Chloroflexota bacterium]